MSAWRARKADIRQLQSELRARLKHYQGCVCALPAHNGAYGR